MKGATPSYLHLLSLLLLFIIHVEAQSPKGNEISDTAFNEIIANYYNSTPFYGKIDPDELLSEFANKKVIRKRKLRPKKKEPKVKEMSYPLEPMNLPLKKMKKRIHLRQRQTTFSDTSRQSSPTPFTTVTTASTTMTPYPTEPPHMRNRPIYVPKPENMKDFSERSYDYEIDYFDRNGLRGGHYDEYDDDKEPLFFSDPELGKKIDPKEEEMLYAELENLFPAQSKSDRDPGYINYNKQEYKKANFKKEMMKDSPPSSREQPIYTPKYGHPYAEPLSQRNPMDTGIYDTGYVDPQTGHFDIPKIHQANEKYTEFVPTIPTTIATTTTRMVTTSTPMARTTTTKQSKPKPSLVKSLQRRFPRINDYDYQKLPSKENFEAEKDVSHLKAEHRIIHGSSFANHPGYRDLPPPPQRRRTPPRRQFHNTYKKPQFGHGNNRQHPSSPTQFVELSKEQDFFVPSTSFGQNVFNSPYSSQYDETPKPKPMHPQYKTQEQQRYPTPKPKKVVPPTRSRFSSYGSSRPQYQSYSQPPTYTPPKVNNYIPPKTYNAPQKNEYKPIKQYAPEDSDTQIDSKFHEFRGNSEFSGYLDQSGHKEVVYDYDRGFPLLPPPPAMVATTQNFFGFSDVPKLGSKVNYNPPELIYNQLYENQFALGRKDAEEKPKNEGSRSNSFLNDGIFSSRSSASSYRQQGAVQPSPRRRQGSQVPSQRYLHKPYQSNGPFDERMMYQ
uniref:Adhesive plaque matrix protein-like n=1 Tax=Lepeophtheirus salmonis TaxID=72036 RepID=A0A0K2TFF8_LEPSM